MVPADSPPRRPRQAPSPCPLAAGLLPREGRAQAGGGESAPNPTFQPAAGQASESAIRRRAEFHLVCVCVHTQQPAAEADEVSPLA